MTLTVTQNIVNLTLTVLQSGVTVTVNPVIVTSGTSITKTSELQNDGATGVSVYVESSELGAAAFSNDYNDLDNKPSLDGFVPYTGASENVDLGDKTISAATLTDSVNQDYKNEIKLSEGALTLITKDVFSDLSNTLEVTPSSLNSKKYVQAPGVLINPNAVEPIDIGKIVWNEADGTFDMGLLNSVTLQAGQEMHIYAKAESAILSGDAVQFAGSQGSHLLVKKAAPTEINLNPELFIGIATQDFEASAFGYTTVFGQVRNLDTSTFALGSILYYRSTGIISGLLTALKPTAPNAKISVASVVRSHQTQGALFVRPHVMPKLESLQNVKLAEAPQDGDVLIYNAALSAWENKKISGLQGTFNFILSTPVSYTGSAAEVEVLRLELPPYTFAANDMFKIPTLLIQKTGLVNSYSIRVKLSTSPTMPATTTDMVALYNGLPTTTQVNMSRTWFLSEGVLRGLGTSNTVTDGVGSTVQLNILFDHAVTNYLYISIDSAGGQDTQTLVGFQLTNR